METVGQVFRFESNFKLRLFRHMYTREYLSPKRSAHALHPPSKPSLTTPTLASSKTLSITSKMSPLW